MRKELAALAVLTLSAACMAGAAAAENDTDVMTYEEYTAADVDTQVCIEAYVQAKQAWDANGNAASVYLADDEGAYFLYNLPCSEEDYESLAIGTKIKVTGYKSEWSGEVEIIDSSYEIIDDGDIAFYYCMDMTDLLGTDELIDYQNSYVTFRNLTVEASTDPNGNEVAFLYNWDGSGEKGSDLYFNVSDGTNTYNFTVESDLCDQDSDVYQAVENLEIGQTIDLNGFLYWYNGANPHITKIYSITSYEDFLAADVDTLVCIDSYIQAKQAWDPNKSTASLYLEDENGAYFIYAMPCSEEDYDLMETGDMIRVAGYKSEWSGEYEIADAAFEFVTGISYTAEPVDVTEYLGTDDLVNYQNLLVSFKGLTVEASTDPNGNEVAFLYNWDGSGEKGSDLYFNVSDGTNTYNFTVESDLCDMDSDVYQAVENLSIGDRIDLEGFLYWYNGANPHITSVTAAE